LHQKRCHEERDQKVSKLKQTLWAETAQQFQKDNNFLKVEGLVDVTGDMSNTPCVIVPARSKSSDKYFTLKEHHTLSIANCSKVARKWWNRCFLNNDLDED